ncbi:MAG: DUF1109 domain-containing protein [Hyphomonadaceae bacterium]|nr:DUF1109 domain-containing protein [Hyphomonadaceae bacterium]
MKTDELIALLATDAKKPATPFPVMRRLGPAALAGAIIALAALFVWLGIRDMGEAVASSSYWMKTLYTAALAVSGFLIAERLSRPGANATRGAFALVAVVAIMLGIGITQLLSTPPEAMRDALLGSTWDRCPWRIVALAIPGLALSLLAMRRLAPTRPTLAGAGAGLFVGGIAATVYGLHCAETSAAFTLIWYTGGVALSTALGAIAGWRVLRW